MLGFWDDIVWLLKLIQLIYIIIYKCTSDNKLQQSTLTDMQSQITRILNSELGSQILQSLQVNQNQITKLERLLSDKNSQVVHLHHLINNQLQITVQENNKLKELNKLLIKELDFLKSQLFAIQRYIKQKAMSNFSFSTQISQMISKKIASMTGLRLEDTANKNQKGKVQSTQTQGQPGMSTNNYLLERLQKMEKTVLSLKQEKWSLEKQLKKFQSLYISNTSPERQYSSNRSLSQQQKRLQIIRCFETKFQQLEEVKFCGQMIANKKNGKGVCYYKSNLGQFIYEGQFMAGLRHGIGQIKFQDQIIYKGFWKSNLPTGKGCLYFFNDQNALQYSGFFKQGSIQGYGTLFYQNGEKVRGFFSSGKIKGVALIENQQSSRLQLNQYESYGKNRNFNIAY